MSDYPRRRRLDPEPPKPNGGLPLVPLVVLVIFGGLLLGGLLTKFFGAAPGARLPTSAPTFTPLPGVSATPAQQPSAAPHVSPVPSPKHRATPKPSPRRAPTPRPSPPPTGKPTVTPPSAPTPLRTAAPRARPSVIILTPAPAPTPTPVPASTPSAAPVATNAPVAAVPIIGAATAEHAAAIVRSYVAALERGDSATATGYLANGLPNESFISPNVSVNVRDLRTTNEGSGRFTVTAQIETSKGSYLETFSLRSGPYGLQITDHNAVPM